MKNMIKPEQIQGTAAKKTDIYQYLTAVTDRTLCPGNFYQQIRKITALQPPALILREKDLSSEEYLELARQVRDICLHPTGDLAPVPFYVHGRPEIARAIGCPRLHLPFSMLRSFYEDYPGEFVSISVSCHSMEDMLEAVRAGADRIILGTIFETGCKPGLTGRGLGFLREVCQACDVPVYAIGGITESNIEDVLAAGASGGCMMSGYMLL